MRAKRLAALALAFGLTACLPARGAWDEQHSTPAPGPAPLVNPLKGWAPWAETAACSLEQGEEPNFTLAFVLLTWRELEPQPGEYAFDAVERAHGMDILRRAGVRFVLRVVCDYPGDEAHLDIPDWLYEETDGVWYDSEYGRGYSPDYTDPAFLEAHGALLEALGTRYGADGAVAWVELGSLGHWGEWHVDEDAGIDPFPTQDVTDQYIRQYRAAFPRKEILLRRPYALGAEAGCGLYNDSFGQADSHRDWLDWIEHGYTSSENGEALAGMPGFWRTAPSGGELASDREVWAYALEDFESTLALVQDSHTTFLGPHAFGTVTAEDLAEDLDPDEAARAAANIETLSREMGYCFALTGTTVRASRDAPDLQFELTVANRGVAPFYANWPMTLRLVDEDGVTVRTETVDAHVADWLPGSHSFRYTFAGSGSLPPGRYRLLVGLLDPLTGAPGVRFANQPADGDPCLYEAAVFEKHF